MKLVRVIGAEPTEPPFPPDEDGSVPLDGWVAALTIARGHPGTPPDAVIDSTAARPMVVLRAWPGATDSTLILNAVAAVWGLGPGSGGYPGWHAVLDGALPELPGAEDSLQEVPGTAVAAYLEMADRAQVDLMRIDFVGTADKDGRIDLGRRVTKRDANGAETLHRTGYMSRLRIARGEAGHDRVYTSESGREEMILSVPRGAFPDDAGLLARALEERHGRTGGSFGHAHWDLHITEPEGWRPHGVPATEE